MHSGCDPSQLLEFLAGGLAAAASEAAYEAASKKMAEEELLDKVAILMLQRTLQNPFWLPCGVLPESTVHVDQVCTRK